MSKYIIDESTLTGIADAIRAKKGTSDPVAVTDFATEVESIETAPTYNGEYVSLAAPKEATVTITNAANSQWANPIYVLDNDEGDTRGVNPITTLGIGETITVSVPIGKYIYCSYYDSPTSVLMPYNVHVSCTGDIECVDDFFANYLINGNGSITYRVYDAD